MTTTGWQGVNATHRLSRRGTSEPFRVQDIIIGLYLKLRLGEGAEPGSPRVLSGIRLKEAVVDCVFQEIAKPQNSCPREECIAAVLILRFCIHELLHLLCCRTDSPTRSKACEPFTDLLSLHFLKSNRTSAQNIEP